MPKIYINYKLILYIILSIFALILRFLDLSDRAVHHDESLHGFFSFITSQGDYYNHNPLTHGMFLFNTLSSFFWLFTDNNYILRLPFAIFGFLLIFIPLLLRKELGFIPCYIFSIFLTISPSIAYFSRFARNDIFMAFFLLIFIISIIKFVKSSQNFWIYISVASLSIGYTIKESMYINVLGLLIFLFFYSLNDIKNVILGKISIDKITNELMENKDVKTIFPFGHVADGNIHFIIGKDSDKESITREVNEIIYSNIESVNGSISAEHGIGIDKKNI